ncbi:DUF932 domain-containing protein [Silvanigrella paludirubra]|uniref:DUF932 domain-containing protein n=1 Tax=Silvanigrella paludirubra TaxID=2499159 RepID=A0A6N6VUD5_9BACT|nr:DUF932 domain-containing protein [Silvanigrella paludirubra]KAB8039166.1 DUF932 domain-containing protein [Silvanigrella paludirubra]
MNYSYDYRNSDHSPLLQSQLVEICPAAFAQTPSCVVSNKYNFISTKNIMDILEKNKFLPYSAMQSRARTIEKKETTKHMIRFRHSESKRQLENAGGLIPEIVLMTSHDGLSSFRFMSGIFRFVCTNGLIKGDINSSINIRHVGSNESDIIDAVFEVLDTSNSGLLLSSEMQKIDLSESQKIKFASEAYDLRFDDHEFEDFSPLQLLTPRRYADKSENLFNIFNATQENLIRGGIRVFKRDEKGYLKRSRTRAVGSIEANLKINKGLWNLAEKYLR